MRNGLKTAALFAVATAVAQGQYTGVSHPEQVPAQTPMTTSADGIQQPLVYVPTPPAAAASVGAAASSQSSPAEMKLKVRPEDGIVTETAAAPVLREGAVRDGAPTSARAYAEGALPDADARIVTGEAEGPANELPEGTLIKARIREEITTTGDAAGKEFHADLTEAVERNGRVLIPAGAMLSGRVTEVHSGRRISGSASIHLQPLEVTMPDGVRYRIKAQVVDTDIYKQVKVDAEGTIVRRDHAGKTLATLGLATGAGAAAGGVIGGVPGAVVGGAVGAGVGTAVWLKQDRQTEIPAGTKLVFSLNQALVVGRE